MATHNEGNKFLLIRLNSNNYHQWKFGTEMALLKENLWEVVVSDKPKEISEIWKKQDNSARATIALSVEPSLHHLIMDCRSASEMWNKLKNQFERVSYSSKIFLKRRLLNTKIEGNNMEEYLTKITELVTKLRLGGTILEDEDVISIILCGLTEDYDGLIMAFEAREEATLTLEVVKMKLRDEAQRKEEKWKSVTTQVLLSSQNRNNRYYQQKSERVCYNCRRQGHIKFECPDLRKNAYQNKNSNEYDQKPRKEINYLTFEDGSKEIQLRKEKNEEQLLFSTLQDTVDEGSEKFYAYVSLTHNDKPISTEEGEWVMDSGATAHMTHNRDLFDEYEQFVTKKEVMFANGTSCTAVGKGTILIKDAINKESTLIFKNTIYVPDMCVNLLSVPVLCKQGFKTVFEDNCCEVTENDEVILQGQVKNGIFVVTPVGEPMLNSCMSCIHVWHKRLGHRSMDTIKEMAQSNQVINLKISKCEHPDIEVCEACQLGGMQQKSFKTVKHKQSSRPFQMIHSDLCGPVRPTSRGGGNYFVTLLDDYSRYCYVKIVANKSDATQVIIEYMDHFRNKFNYYPEFFRSDNGGEFENGKLNEALKQRGIHHQLSIAYQPQQNGLAEKINLTLIKMTKCIMAEKDLCKDLWGEILSSSCYLYNRVTHSYSGNIPYCVWENKPVDLNNIRIIGSQCYSYVNKQNRSKLDDNATSAVLLGYGHRNKGYKVMNVVDKQISVSSCVVFNEKISVNHTNPENEQTTELEIEIPYVMSSENVGVINDPKVNEPVRRTSLRSNAGVKPLRYR